MSSRLSNTDTNHRLRDLLRDSKEIYATMFIGKDMDDREVEIKRRWEELPSIDKNIMLLYVKEGRRAKDVLQISGTYLYKQLNRIKEQLHSGLEI